MNKRFHGIMFHHFHGYNHPKVQGSICDEELANIINYLKKNYTILNANDFLHKAFNDKLDNKHICLTFDDGLLNQFEIALPVLDDFKIKAFFNIYSSIFTNTPSNLEIFRYFRTTHYKNISNFYKDFFNLVENNDIYLKKEREIFNYDDYLSSSIFLSKEDKWFRYLRDHILSKNKFEELNYILMKKKSFNFLKVQAKLWMKEKDINSLYQSEHQIGLHTHNHPTNINILSLEEQEKEYSLNMSYLTKIIKSKILSMSHPCGRYSSETLEILKKLGITIGFRSNMELKTSASLLEIPRENHTNILEKI